MNNKTIALSSAAAVLLSLCASAWAGSHSSAEVKAEEAATTEVEAPARLCIPREEAEAAPATDAEQAKPEGDEAAPAAEAADAEQAKPEGDEAESEASEGDAEVSLPVCDEDGNPPAAEEAAEGEAPTEAAKTE